MGEMRFVKNGQRRSQMCQWIYVLLFLYVLQVVLGAPSWVVQPSDQTVQEGSQVNFSCVIQDRGSSPVIWYKDGNGLFLNDQPDSGNVEPRYSIQGEYNLIIDNVQVTDEGTFKCQLWGFDSVEVVLIVLTPPTQPQLTLQPNSQTFSENSVIDFTCSTDRGFPHPTIEWLRNGLAITGVTVNVTHPSSGRGTSSSHFPWTLRRTDHSANFSCVVYNEVNQNSPKIVSRILNVQYKPHITFSPSYNPFHVKSGAPKTLQCIIDANPSTTQVQWRKDGSILQSSSQTIQFNPVRKSDSGQYSCSATNSMGTSSATVTLNVIYAPHVTTPLSLTVNISSQVNLSCSVDANPAPYSVGWERINSPLTNDGNNFVFIAVKQSAGTYRCTARNRLHPSGQDQAEDVSSSNNTTLLVRYMPGRASINPVSSVLVASSVTLTCTVDDQGYPAASFEWRKVGGNVLPNQGSKLNFPNAKLEDNGNYTCTPHNMMGRGTSATIQLNVDLPPRFLETERTEKTIAITNTALILRNRIEGRPLPTVRWYKNGVPLNDPDHYAIQTNANFENLRYIVETELKFEGPSRGSGTNKLRIEDIGVYTCNVTSTAVNTPRTASTNIQIYFKPVVTMPTLVAEDISQSTTLTCKCQSNPRPYFFWYKDGSALSNTSRITITQNQLTGLVEYQGQLTIQNIRQTDLGQYTCEVNNSVGTGRASTVLTVKSKPYPPTNIVLLDKTWESVNLKWTPGFDGGRAQAFFVHVDSIDGPRTIEVIPHNVYTKNVTELMPSTSYRFTVFARNELGEGNHSDVFAVQTDALNFLPIKETPEYFVEENRLTLSSGLNSSYCLRVQVSEDNGHHWTTVNECVLSNTEQISMNYPQATNVNVSVCLVYRPTVCGESVAAKIKQPGPPDLTETQVIIIGCVCAAILIVLLVILIIILCRRWRANKKYANQPSSASQPAIVHPVNGVSSPKHLQRGYDNQDGVHFDNRNGYPPQFLNHHGDNIPLDTSYDSQIEKQMYENEMNRRNANMSADPYYSEKQGDISYSPRTPTKDPQQFLNLGEERKGEGGSQGSGVESGYSTPDPAKPKKVIYEVVV